MSAVPVALPTTFVALGDSFTEGMQDERGPDGRHMGWADRVAAAIATRTGGLRYANLAIRGRLLDQVVDEQLPVALELIPDLVSFHAGANDVLRPRGPAVADILGRYDAAVAQLRAAGSEVLVFTVLERTGGSGRTAARLAARFQLFNDGVRATAQLREGLLVDVGPVAALHDPGSGTRTACTSPPRVMPESRPPCSRLSASTSPR